MSDLIDRQAAIELVKDVCDAIMSGCKRHYDSEVGDEVYDDTLEVDAILKCNKGIRNALRDMPSAQPEQRWIPCSEVTGDGYPEEDGFYYVTEQNYGFYLDAVYKQRVTHTSHFKNGDFTDRFYTENNSNITAWMPLPKPWKGEDDGSDGKK